MNKIKFEIDSTEKILLKRYLNKNGKAQLRFTKDCAKEMNNYIPFKSGRLKDESVSIETTRIIYNTPYAKKQFYTNAGNGTSGTSFGGLRGKRWDKRMWSQRGNGIIKSIADFVGGKVK